jgi:hypothetical protein
MVSAFYGIDHSGCTPPETPAISGPPKRLTPQERSDLIAWVQVWYDAGCAVHPAKTDGSKMPLAVKGGSPDRLPDVFPATYQKGQFAGMPHPRAGQPDPDAGQYGWGWGRIATGDMSRLTVDQIAARIRAGHADGIGVICGRASGGVMMLEAEGRARELMSKVREAAVARGCLPLLERLAAGCVDESPSGGLHFYLRSADGIVAGNTVLAARPNPGAEKGREVLFETRGQGGWSAVAPSAGRTHKSGKPYRFLRGGPETIPTFTQDEIALLFDVFRAVDEMPKVDPASAPAAVVQRRDRPAGEILPGDDYNERAAWEEILPGWTWLGRAGDRQLLNTPLTGGGRQDGQTRATITGDVLYVFSTSTPLPSGKGLSKFAAYAHLNHGGDFAAAARELWNQGYGSRREDGDDGGQPIPVEPRPLPTGDQRTLADWRDEVADRRAAAVVAPGQMSLDRSPTGAGKTHATIEALRLVKSALIVLPTHANVREVTADMQDRGHDAAAFPERTPETCQHYTEAAEAQRLGLQVGAAVCPGCPFNRKPKDGRAGNTSCRDQGDQYLYLMKQAEGAAFKVATHEMLRRSSKVAEGAQVVVIDETPEQVVAPTVAVTVGQITPVETLANAIKNHWYVTATPDQKSFAGALLEVVAAIHATCSEVTTAGHRPVSLQVAHAVPDNWQRLLFDAIKQIGANQQLDADALTLVTKAATGGLLTLEIVTDLTRAGRLVHFVVGSWRTSVPADAAVVMLDATGNADDIAAVISRPVIDCTPDGHLPTIHPVVQIPDDISRGASSDTVAGLVEAFLTAHPEVQRLGIIGHRQHVTDLIDGGLLGSAARERVAKWCYFGQGPDRASNDWHRECDHLLRLGTPRANPGDYRRWLVQHGLHDAAGKVDGDWSPRDWEAVTVDGEAATVRGYGYRDPDWHRAYVAVSRASSQQADGRGRSRLPEGIPVTVLSNDPTGYPVAPSLEADPGAARETVEIIRGLISQQARPLITGSAKSPIGNTYSNFCASGAVPTGDALTAIMAAAGIDRRAAQVRLKQCIDRGMLTKPEGRRGWYALPGTSAPTLDAATETTTVVVRPAAPVTVISAAATMPTVPTPAVEVASTPAAPDTATTFDTTQPTPPLPADDVLALIEERAAIMEHDGGADRETADRLAREMVLGRDAVLHPAAVTEPITAHVDVPGLHARTLPYVDATVQRIPGTVTVLSDRTDPFAAARKRSQPRRPGVCQCGHDDWVQVPIHGGKSIRVDCGHCDRFGWFGVWYGKRQVGSSDAESPPAAPESPTTSGGLSFDFLPTATAVMSIPTAV